VRDHHGRLPAVLNRLPQQLEDLAAGLGVEVAGRLVGEDDGRLRDESAGDRHALLLAAGELGGPVHPPVLEPDRLDELLEPDLVDLLAGDRQRQDDVLLGRQHGQQVEELEDEADVLAAKPRQGRVVEAGDFRAGDRHAAAGRPIEPREDVHQGRLARAGRPHHGGQLAVIDLKRHSAERVHGGVAFAVAAGEVVGDDDCAVRCIVLHGLLPCGGG
jgi:hypothetical protein